MPRCQRHVADNNDTIDLAVLGGLKDDQVLKGYEITQFPSRSTRSINAPGAATVADMDGKTLECTKGAPRVILALSADAGEVKFAVDKAVDEFAAHGFCSLGVARADGDGRWQFLGVLPLFDPATGRCQGRLSTTAARPDEREGQDGDRRYVSHRPGNRQKVPGMGTNILDAGGLGDTRSSRDGTVGKSPSRTPTVSPKFSPNTSSTSWTSYKRVAHRQTDGRRGE